MSTSFYSEEELQKIGFKQVGKNVLLSRNTCIYGAADMVIGNNVRIDDFCVLSGKIVLGDYIHIAVYSAIFGGEAGVFMHDYTCLSSRCIVYAKSDDYSGNYMTNPMIDEEFLGVYSKKVEIKKHVLLGSGTTVLPGVIIEEGSAVGSMSLVNKSLDAWGIYAGVPCKYMKERSKKLLAMEKAFRAKHKV